MDLSKKQHFSQSRHKSQKVLSNLIKIRTLVHEALNQLKLAQRISTNESDSSECLSPKFIKGKSVDIKKTEIEKYFQNLEKGYVMVKHSLNTKPKEKYIYVSSDRRFLCWKSLDKDDEKRVELRKVYLVIRGEEETVRYVQSKSVRELMRLVILRCEKRNLELEAFSIEESVKFTEQINKALIFLKPLHLSQKR